ncbi:MAG: substrate-binding domain-containing protein [Lentisphaeria bacterium]|nr:substrate-binding domain-containing protein [Lentisphaeria bacterium]
MSRPTDNSAEPPKKNPANHATRFQPQPLVLLANINLSLTVKAIVKEAQKLNWQLLDVKYSRGYIPSSPPPAGCIMCGDDPDILKSMARFSFPCVRIANSPTVPEDLPPNVHLTVDIVSDGRLAAEHFAARGFHHIGYIGSTPWADLKPMYESFAGRSAELGVTCHLLRFPPPDNQDQAKLFEERSHQVGEWLRDLPKPVGVFAYNDTMAAKLVNMCRMEGLSVPEEVAILGRGNHAEVCELAPVSLSSINPDREGVGRQAVDLLKRMIDGRPLPKLPLVIPPKGVAVRRSTDILAVEDPVVARAIRFMWDHLAEPLVVDDVAHAVAMGRRTLEKAFRTTLGCGIKEELRRKRLQAAVELLRTTDMPLEDVAERSGVGTAGQLHRLCRREFRATPRQIRKGATLKDDA